MMRYIERNFEGKIISSYASQQLGKRLNQVDDQSEEYKEWEKSLEQTKPVSDGN